jgi:peptide/nickel transport system ATP-binding protein
LEVENLSIAYHTAGGTHLAVDDVSFRLDRGDALGLVGESGCGKTTIGMALMGLLASNARIVAGRICLDGEDLTGVSDVRMRQIRWRQISMIFQAAMNALNPVQRIQEQIAEAIITHEPELSPHAMTHRVRSLANLVRIPEHRLFDYPHQFSGGMRQRVIIAMALACNPSLIIADEPTTALDVIVQNQILSAIATFQREMNIGMLFISHDIAVVADVCSHIGVMHDGRLMEIGTRPEVLDCPGHPYTRMLLESLVTLSDDPIDFLGGIGTVEKIGSPAYQGCTICPVCLDAGTICRQAQAEWVDLTPTHWVRCTQSQRKRQG